MAFVLSNAEVRIAIVEDQEQVDKLLEVKARCPALEVIVYDDPRGLRHYDRRLLRSYDDVQAAGRDLERGRPDFFDREVEQGRASDVAIMLYTSGTTGTPKGVMLSHQNLIETGRGGIHRERLTADEEVLAYLPMAWVGDSLFSYCQGHVAGFCVSCPESPDTVLTDMREIGPTYFFAPPRVLENLLTTVSIRMEDASRFKRWLYARCMDVARRWGRPSSMRSRCRSGRGCCTRWPISSSSVRSGTSSASAASAWRTPPGRRSARTCSASTGRWASISSSSTGAPRPRCFVCIQPNGQVKLESVGTPATGVEVRISEQGEVQVKSPGVFRGYFKGEAATREAMTPDGFFRTGDAGFFDEDGHLRIIDRAKDVGRLQDGTLFAPKYLENKLKFFPFIKEAVAFGDRRALRRGVRVHRPGGGGELGRAPEPPLHRVHGPGGQRPVHDLVRGCVEEVERRAGGRSAAQGLADPALPGAAQGARPRRRRAHPDAEGAPRLHRREVRPAGGGAVRGRSPRSTWRRRSGSRTDGPGWFRPTFPSSRR